MNNDINIGSIVKTNHKFKDRGVTGHPSLIIGKNNNCYYGLELTSNLSKSSYPYNCYIYKGDIQNPNKYYTSSVVKGDNLMKFPIDSIDYKMGDVDEKTFNRLIDKHNDAMQAGDINLYEQKLIELHNQMMLESKYDIHNLPTNVKEIKNMNQFFRDVIDLEDNKYWKDMLKDASSCGYMNILNPNETPLKRKRGIVQQYLNYKHKIEESKYTLKGTRDGETFDISYSDSIDKLEKFKDEEQPHHKDIFMYIVEENKKLEEVLLYHGSPNKNITQLRITNERTTGDEFGAGIYLTSDYEEAKQYSHNGRVYKVQLDDNNLYNLKEKLPENIKNIVKQELLDNKEILNQIVRRNRKQYEVVDKKKGLEFYNNKKKEWQEKDNIYAGNMPEVNKINDKLIVTYTDYEDIDGAINNLTGDELQKILSHNMDPNVFVTLILKAGYDGIITHNDKWYIIYRNEDKVKIVESKHKVEEASRNELLVKSKGETITRYNKAAGYRGFGIVDIDTTSLLTTNSLRVTCRVGDYYDTVEMEDVLYWIQMHAEQSSTKWQVNTKVVTKALMDAIDGMDIKVDCECGDWKYRFAYQATEWGYKYGKPETRPAKITNPSGYGALCKHLISLLGNKRWLQQVTGTVMDWVVKRIDEINRFLNVKEGQELTLPNELARQNAKSAFYSKLFKDKIEDEENEEEQPEEETLEQENEEPKEDIQDEEVENEEEENNDN